MFYKVLTTDLCNINISEEQPKVQYKIDQWTYAPFGTRLFVFDNLASAKEEAKYTHYKIFKCDILNGVHHSACGSVFDIKKFWALFNQQNQAGDVIDLSSIPLSFYANRVYMAEAVKLIEEVLP